MAGRVRVVDKGANRLIRMVRKVTNTPAVRVGVFGDAAAQKHGDTGATVGDIANAHEFGAGVPRRSWLRDTIDQNREIITRNIRRGATEVFHGRLQEYQALELLGLSTQGMIQQRIAAGISPGLSARYLKRKLAIYPGAETPLIASGQFRGSISYALEGSAAKQKSAAVAVSKRAAKKQGQRQKQVKRVRRALRQGLRKAIKSVRANARAGLKLQKKGIKLSRKGAKVSSKLLRKSVRASLRQAKRGTRILKRGLRIKKRRTKK
jgi:hypothetical protein